MPASSSTAPAFDGASNKDYMDIVEEILTFLEEEGVSEGKLIMNILNEYKKEEFEKVENYLACNRFTTAIKELLRKLYSNCHERWIQKNRRMDVMEMPYPIREGKMDAEHMKNYTLEKFYVYNKDKQNVKYNGVCAVTKMKEQDVKRYVINRRNRSNYHKKMSYGSSFVLKNVNGKVKFTPINEDGEESQKDELSELCEYLVDDDKFENHMQAADEYLGSIDESNVDNFVKDRLVLLKFLLAVRKGDGKLMYELVDANTFPLSNQEAMRILYYKGYKDYVAKNGIRTSKGDPNPYPRSITKIKFATKEEQDILEDELRKKFDNSKYVVDCWKIGYLTNRSRKAVEKFINENYYASWNKSREEQDKMREERWAALKESVERQKTKKDVFERRQAGFSKKRKPYQKRKPTNDSGPSSEKKRGRQSKKVVINFAPPNMRGRKRGTAVEAEKRMQQAPKVSKKVTFTLPEEAPVKNPTTNIRDVLEDDEEFLAAFDELNLLMEQAADIVHPHKKVPQAEVDQMEEEQVIVPAAPSEQHSKSMDGNNENETLPRRLGQKRLPNRDNAQLPKRQKLGRACRSTNV